MKKKTAACGITFILLISAIVASCTNEKQVFIDENVTFATAQTQLMLDKVGEPTGKNYPRTMNNKGELVTTGMKD
mgnify:CR=1 FL=1